MASATARRGQRVRLLLSRKGAASVHETALSFTVTEIPLSASAAGARHAANSTAHSRMETSFFHSLSSQKVKIVFQ